ETTPNSSQNATKTIPKQDKKPTKTTRNKQKQTHPHKTTNQQAEQTKQTDRHKHKESSNKRTKQTNKATESHNKPDGNRHIHHIKKDCVGGFTPCFTMES
ncbi:hypothetical protein, partial [Parascardovia denticolens]|uniref:hypothetical protein n=1 Tax=Parascardovia denticolens TaxID=78258 RepID=UPI001ED96C0A